MASYSCSDFIAWKCLILGSNVGQGKANPVKTAQSSKDVLYVIVWM